MLVTSSRLVATGAVLAVLGGTTFAVIAAPATAAAQTRYVDIHGDDTSNDCTDQANPCFTIQHAIDMADPGDTVSIAAGTYHESLRVRTSLTFLGNGSGADPAVIDGATGDSSGPSILVDGVDTSSQPVVLVKDLNVVNNPTDEGIRMEHASVTVVDTTVSHNSGNGINAFVDVDDVGAQTSLVVTNSDISGNDDVGILVDHGAEATVTGSTVSGNVFGGVEVDSGSLSLTTSTVNGNLPKVVDDASEGGCGVCSYAGDAEITTSTIAGNTGQGVLGVNSSVAVTDSTISGTVQAAGAVDGVPTAGVVTTTSVAARTARTTTGAAAALAPGTTLTATIVADNTTMADCAGPVTDGGYNLSSDDSCAFDATGSANNGTAKLGALGDNGGPTQTLLPAKASDAIDAVPAGASTCVDGAQDQRGVDRPQADRCDIGAVEVAQTPISVSPSALPSGTVGHAYRVDLSASGGLGAPYSFSLQAGDSLPPGLHLSPGGVISGVPAQAGHFTFTLSIDDPTLVPRSITISAPDKPAAVPPALPNTGA